MASIAETTTPVVSNTEGKLTLKGLERAPLKLSGALDAFESFDVTPVIGREFPNASLKDFLRAPNSDELLRDLAITGKLRGSKSTYMAANSVHQYLSVVLFSSGNKMASTTTCKRNLFSVWESYPASPRLLVYTSTPS